MGHEDRDLNCYVRDYWSDKQEKDFDDEDYQCSCSEMSSKSGLERLEGLKELRVLSVVRMATRIGVEEVQWMRQNWPKLTMIRGLDDFGEEKEAGHWLQDECPTILSEPCIRVS